MLENGSVGLDRARYLADDDSRTMIRYSRVSGATQTALVVNLKMAVRGGSCAVRRVHTLKEREGNSTAN